MLEARGMMQRTIRLFAIFLGIVLPSLVFAVVDLGEIHHKGEAAALPIQVASSQSSLEGIAKKAFSLHGGYVLVDEENAAYTFRLTPKGARSVELAIESGKPPRVLFKKEGSGVDLTQATLKACDLAVEKTLGIPGFFAGKLAFMSDRNGYKEIYTSDLLFQDVKQITHDRSYSVLPHWSPNGQEMTYTGYYYSAFPDLFLVNMKTGQRKPIATYKGTNTGGVFSPSGKEIAMILSSSGNPELYIANAEGKRPRRITQDPGLEASPTWSPDGKRLIVTSDRRGGPQLYEVNPKTKEMQRLPTNISRYCDEADWNHRKPHLVAFTAAVSRSFQIALYDFKTRKAAFLTKESGDCLEPCWTSDGRHLIFTHRTGRDKQLHILDTKTGKIAPLHTKKFGSASEPSFVYP